MRPSNRIYNLTSKYTCVIYVQKHTNSMVLYLSMMFISSQLLYLNIECVENKCIINFTNQYPKQYLDI